MFDFQRLAKEDYELMGRSLVWTYWDAGVLLSSYEMEVSGEFGTSKDLVSIRRFPSVGEITDVEKLFHGKWSKWTEWLQDEMYAGNLAFVNVPNRSVPEELPEVGVTSISQDRGTFSRDELLAALSVAAEAGKTDLDIVQFYKFLRGEGTAPGGYLKDKAAKLDSARKINNKPKDKNPKQSARGKAGAKGRWSESYETKGVVEKYALEMDSQGCTCNHAQLAMTIHEHAVDENGKALLGKSEMSLDVVKKTVKKLFKEKGIKRVRGADIFKDETACMVHHPEEYRHQQQKRSR